MDILDVMIDHREAQIRKKVGWVLNNIMNGTKDIIQVILDHKVYKKLLSKLSLDVIEVRIELLSAILGYLLCANN